MLGTTAGGMFWTFRYLERSENTARLVDAGLRIALTRSTDRQQEWSSVLSTAGARPAYLEHYGEVNGPSTIDFLLRDRANPSSVLSVIDNARQNARRVRTALTREVWEAINQTWMSITEALHKPIAEPELPQILAMIRQESALVRGVLHGTMMRNDVYDFGRLGTFTERADNTARILDVKYHILLPSAILVGSRLDNLQWETILRSVSSQRAYRWEYPGEIAPANIADFLILNPRMPRSLTFCFTTIENNLGYLADDYGERAPSHDLADKLRSNVQDRSIGSILEEGLHEFLQGCINDTSQLAGQIELDYRFNE